MTEPANVILFQSDNHARQVLGCYGHPVVRTPHLDSIANAGVRFENAYCTSPLCCPSRASLATGRYPHQTGYWDNCLVYDGTWPSWARRLRDRGHTVVSVGKLHYRSNEDDNGFSEEIAPMHIVNGVGGLVSLLRWSDEEPAITRQWELYRTRTGVGTTSYQDYDREITRLAIAWLHEHAGAATTKPWVLYVSYPSAHPPFTVPQRLWNLYPPDGMPLPVKYKLGERPEHPAFQHLRRVLGFEDMHDEGLLRRVAAGYFALITHLDEQIGQVMSAAQSLGLLSKTRLIYTSDHGESYGNHGLFGKSQLLDTAAKVPLMMAGPGIRAGRVVRQIVSHVDLFPTVLEAAGARLETEDRSLPGISLWSAVHGREQRRLGFAEFHATGSRTGSFMLRDGYDKLIYHAGMPSQVFDLERDPHELTDLVDIGRGHDRAERLEATLRQVVNPDEADARAKSAQRDLAEKHGGSEAIRKMGALAYSPPPGTEAELEPVS